MPSPFFFSNITNKERQQERIINRQHTQTKNASFFENRKIYWPTGRQRRSGTEMAKGRRFEYRRRLNWLLQKTWRETGAYQP